MPLKSGTDERCAQASSVPMPLVGQRHGQAAGGPAPASSGASTGDDSTQPARASSMSAIACSTRLGRSRRRTWCWRHRARAAPGAAHALQERAHRVGRLGLQHQDRGRPRRCPARASRCRRCTRHCPVLEALLGCSSRSSLARPRCGARRRSCPRARMRSATASVSGARSGRRTGSSGPGPLARAIVREAPRSGRWTIRSLRWALASGGSTTTPIPLRRAREPGEDGVGVAHRGAEPTRCTSCRWRAMRSMTLMRCAPRSVPASACTSSTITTRRSRKSLAESGCAARRASPRATRAWSSAGPRARFRNCRSPVRGVAVPHEALEPDHLGVEAEALAWLLSSALMGAM
jgi:hypothetical protein